MKSTLSKSDFKKCFFSIFERIDQLIVAKIILMIISVSDSEFSFFSASRKPEFRQANTTAFQQMNEAYRRLNGMRNASTGDMPLTTNYQHTSRKSRSITLPVTLERSVGLENGSPMDVASNMQENQKPVCSFTVPFEK